MKKLQYKQFGLLIVIALLVPLLLFRPASAAIAFRAAASANNAGGSTTLSIAMPTGTVQNDVMVAIISYRGGTGDFLTPPSGWTPVNGTDSGTTLGSQTYIKTAGASEAGPYNFTISTSQKASGVIASYSGVDTNNRINVDSALAYASSTTLTSPPVSTTVPNTWVIAAFSTATGTTVTPGSSMTERGENASTGAGAGSRTTTQLQDILQSGTGSTGAKNATAGGGAVNIGHTIVLNPAPVVSQVGYKFFANSTTSGSVSSQLANQDTVATAPAAGTPFRLRMLLGITDAQAAVSLGFKLQYKARQGTTCTSTGTFTDISTTTPVRYYDNAGTADGYTPLNSSGSDPFRSGVNVVNQSYEEANNFSVSTAIPAGEDGMWDFALTMGVNADSMAVYCLRAAYASGAPISTYSVFPAIQTYGTSGVLSAQDYRWYANADSTTPGGPLAAVDTAATFSSSGGNARLRVGVGGNGYFKQISAGTTHSCGIGSDDLAYCWGSDAWGALGNGTVTADQPTPVPVDTSGVLSGKTILSISAGQNHTCAIASDNNAYCWGYDASGQLGNGATTGTQASPVAVDTTGDLSGLTVWAISAGGSSTCAIASDNNAYCWGADNTGQIGNGAISTGNRTSPGITYIIGALSGKTILNISVGSEHACVIASDNNAYCWGADAYGQLGNGATTGNQDSAVAVDTSGVLSGKTIKSISSGGYFTCVVASDNQSYCWGMDTSGQLGNGSTTGNQVSPSAVDTSGVLSGNTISDIQGGANHACAITSDVLLYCWGSDSTGQLGNGSTTGSQVSPVAVDTSGVLSGKSLLAVSLGADHTCAITTDNQNYCWGSDGNGELGNGATTGTQVSPYAMYLRGVLYGKTATKIAAGNSHTCMVTSDNKAYCWGSNGNGQLGIGTTGGQESYPVQIDMSGVLSGKTITDISAGLLHTCAIASDNLVYCWGADSNGQLGNGATTGDQASPVAVDTSGVLSGKTITGISAGNSHTCAIASDNLVYCWGTDLNGQLGNGATTGDQASPVALDMSGVLSGKTIEKIEASDTHNCVIASDNQAYCWGSDTSGELGNGATTGTQQSPVAVDTSGVLSGKSLLDITTGGNHTCAVATDGSAYCWGSDTFGHLGNGATTGNQVSPVAVDTSSALSGKTVSSITAGNYVTCAIASDNQAYCWGGDTFGKLGNGAATSDQPSPVAVDNTGYLMGKTVSAISAGQNSHVCAIASGNAYCWGYDNVGKLGNGASTSDKETPDRVMKYIISTLGISSGKVNVALQFAQKTAGSCSAQTGFADVTGSTVIAFNANATPANAAAISSSSSDPIGTSVSAPQTYHEATGTVTNPSDIAFDKYGLWDFSLKDNSAPGNTTYCLRLVGSDGATFNEYNYYPEITTAVPPGPTLDQMTRGGGGVLNGVKQNYSW